MDVDPPPDLVNTPNEHSEFALGSGEAIPQEIRPPWLLRPPPKKRPFAWPSGAKSPSFFRLAGTCLRRHAQRYRYKRADPPGLEGIVGSAVHGAIEDAANIRMFPGRRGRGIPSTATSDELLYLLEFQRESIRQNLDVIEAPKSYSIVTAEVLARSRQIIAQLEPIDLSNLWIDPSNGKGGAEYIWQYLESSNLLIAGIADLIQIQPNPANPAGAPLQVTITDWKTGPGKIPTQRELELDPQACLQLIWARRAFPATPTIRFRLWNLSQNARVEIDWSPGIEEITRSFVRSCWNLWITKVEDASTGSHCPHCPYRMDCKAYQEELRKATFHPPVGSLDQFSMPKLIEERYRAWTLEKLADRRRKDCDKLIMKGLGGKKDYRHGRFVARRKSRRNSSFRDEGLLLERLSIMSGVDQQKLVSSLCEVRKGKLEDWIKTLPAKQQKRALELMDEHQTLTESRPWIEVDSKEVVI